MWRKYWYIPAGLALLLVLYLARGHTVDAETAPAQLGDVREYIAEDGKTRLERDYLISMPLNGRLERVTLKEGDRVRQGQVVAHLRPYELRQQLGGLASRLREIDALIQGVDVSKPKPQDLEAARLKVAEARLRLRAAQRQRDIAITNRTQAQRAFERQRALLRDGVTAREQYDQAEAAYKNAAELLRQARLQEEAAGQELRQAELARQRLQSSVDDNEYQRRAYQAQIRQLQAQRNVTRDQLQQTAVTSPVSGPVLELLAKDRRDQPAGTPIMRIGDLSSVTVETDILSEEIPRVRVGQPVELSGKALAERVLEGRVQRIYPSAFTKISALGIEQQRIKVIVSFDNSRLQLRPGTSLDVRIVTGQARNVVTVPERALFKDNGRWHVFVAAGGYAQLRPVTVGLKNDERAAILAGLSAGEQVITEPGNALQPGTRLRTTPGDRPADKERG